MSREYLAEFLLHKVRISASQEEVLNAIPGWEEEVSRIIDDTPSQPESPGSQQRIFDVTGSSVSDGDQEEDLSQKPVEWASPEPTPKAAPPAAIGLESYHEPFDSDRSQSPKRRLSWGFSRPEDLPSSESDQRDTNSGDKIIRIVDADHGVTEAPHEKKDVAGSTSTAALHMMSNADELQDARRGVKEKVEPWGQRLSPEAEEQVPSKHSEPALEDGTRDKSFNAKTIAGDSSQHSGQAACPDDGRVCVRNSSDNLKANEKMAGCAPKIDSSSAHLVSSGKSLRVHSSSSSSSSDSEGEERHNPSMPSKAVQEKLKKIRRLGAEKAIGNQSRKRGRGEHKTLHVREDVMDVVRQMSDGKPGPILSGADLLRAALLVGITLPPPFSHGYFRSQ